MRKLWQDKARFGKNARQQDYCKKMNAEEQIRNDERRRIANMIELSAKVMDEMLTHGAYEYEEGIRLAARASAYHLIAEAILESHV